MVVVMELTVHQPNISPTRINIPHTDIGSIIEFTRAQQLLTNCSRLMMSAVKIYVIRLACIVT